MYVDLARIQGRFSLDLCFEGAPDGVTALYGLSGAGKSTVVNMVAGLLRPDAGKIVVHGRCLFDSERGVDLPPEQRRMGYVFQEGRLFPHYSVRANLCYGMKLLPQARRVLPFDQVVDLLGLGQLLERRPRNLSGGEKQRVAIGRALLTSPAALLMDEPLASLDEARKEELLSFISRINREFAMPVLYVSHALTEIRRLASTIVTLREGRIAGVEQITVEAN